MKCIDFDKKFQSYIERWIEDNRGKYPSVKAMEDDIDTIYEAWLNRPQVWLDGKSPRGFFAEETDAQKLVDWIVAYDKEKLGVPEPLLDRVVDLKAEAELLALLDSNAGDGPKITAVSLLNELQSAAPIERYVKRIRAFKPGKKHDEDELAEAMSYALKEMGEGVIEPCLSALEGASYGAAECLLDVLSGFPDEPRTYDPLVEYFRKAVGRRDMWAMFLAEYGDARAIPVMEAFLESEDINFTEFIEIRAAIESLGGEVTLDRTFPGDPRYEAMLRLRQEEDE